MTDTARPPRSRLDADTTLRPDVRAESPRVFRKRNIAHAAYARGGVVKR